MMDLITHVVDVVKGKHSIEMLRSSHWPSVRKRHLEENPFCEVCGGTKKLQVHHKKPFHLHPELELDPLNLITLCESGKGGVTCHLHFGHCGNFQQVNPDVAADASTWRTKLTAAKSEMRTRKLL